MTIVSVAIIILLFSLVEVLSECGSECIDIDPPGEYNCIEQAAFGKCSEEWMINCNCACDRCPSNTNDVVKSSKVIALKQQNDLCSGNSLQNGLEEHDLHVVIDSTQGDIIIDTDADGQQQVTLDGKASHTHQPGESITYFKWTDENGQIITEGENAQTASATIPTGEHAWNLQIFDGQQKSLSACYAFTVTSNRAVPGTLIKWYPGLKTLDFDAKSQKAKFAQFNKNLNVEPPFPITADAIVEIKGSANVAFGSYEFFVTGGSDYKIFVGDVQHATDRIYDGQIQFSIKIQVNNNEDLPINVKMMGQQGEVTDFFHNDENEGPIISSLTEDQGPASGGNKIKIFGNFINPQNTEIFIGNSKVDNQKIESITSQSITFEFPSGELGKTNIKVISNGKSSNQLEYEYQGLVFAENGGEGSISSFDKFFEYAPVQNNPFFTQKIIKLPKKATSLAWCHGKLYACAAYSSTIQEITFDENYEIISLQQFDTQIGDSQSILDIGCDPKEKNSPNWKLYFTHTQLYYQSAELEFFQPHLGKVSYVTAPEFSNVVTIVSGLPTSNHDHGLNKLQFGNNGKIYVTVGGNTNAGVASGKLGGLEESPYSASVVEFGVEGGHVTCEFASDTPSDIKSNQDPMDARYSKYVQCWGLDIYATGLRNSFGLLQGQSGDLYATDNGPNWDFGACLEYKCGNGWFIPDRIVKVTKGAWYGHPNPTRGQNKFVPAYAEGQNGSEVSLIRLKKGGTAGLCEYTSQTFRGQWFGHFFVQRFQATQYRCDPNFTSCIADTEEYSRPSSAGTDCAVLPGGVVAVAQFPTANLALNLPQDQDAEQGMPICFDVTPWRGVIDTIFHIACANLHKCNQELEVFFCSSKAEVTKTGDKWIEGITPAATGNCQVQVNCGGVYLPKINSYQFL